MNEIALAARFWLEANPRAARLKRFAVRAGRNLAEFVARGQPDFDIVRLRRSKAHVTRTKQNGAVVQAELLENNLGISYQGFVLFITFLRMGELEKLHFLKLMLAQDA